MSISKRIMERKEDAGKAVRKTDEVVAVLCGLVLESASEPDGLLAGRRPSRGFVMEAKRARYVFG